MFDAAEAGSRPAARAGAGDFVVLGWRGRARMLVPRRGRLAARGLVTGRLALVRPREALMRRVLGLGLATGLPQQVLGARHRIVSTSGPAGAESLIEALRARWDPRVSAVGFSVRRVTPNYKPTFVAVGAKGELLGFGKVASDPGTRNRLAGEATALREMERAAVPGLKTPRLLADFVWSGRRVIIIEPVPATSQRYADRAHAPLLLVRQARERGSVLDVGGYAAALARTVAREAPGKLADAASAYAGHIAREHGGLVTASGRSHGDLVPWNLATDGTVIWAWDWEHSRAEDAVTLDLVHWHVQIERWVNGHGAVEAFARATPAARADCATAGVGPAETDAVLALGRLAIAARTAELVGGSGVEDAELERGVLDLLLI